MSVYAKINEARARFHELKLTKTGENKFAGYKYFELGDFLTPALKVFKDVGLCAMVSFTKDEASMTIIDTESPESVHRITSPMGSAALKGCHEVQNVGAVETYQRRYLWVAALEIVEHDALDAVTGKPEPKQKPALRPSPSNAKPTSGAGAGLSPERKAEIEEMALYMIDCHKDGNDLPAIEMCAEISDADEKVYLWSLLGAESKLRATIKANSKAQGAT